MFGVVPNRPVFLERRKVMRPLLSMAVVGASTLGLLFAPPPRVRAGPVPATIRVRLPGDAKLTIDGAATQSTAADRWFITPPLEQGKTFHYTFRAEFVRGDKTITVTEQVPVRAGRETAVSLNYPEVLGRPAPGYAWAAVGRGATSTETRSYYFAPGSDEAAAGGIRPAYSGVRTTVTVYGGDSSSGPRPVPLSQGGGGTSGPPGFYYGYNP
jgi:uncharacterized protein (TIGR03000 family)